MSTVETINGLSITIEMDTAELIAGTAKSHKAIDSLSDGMDGVAKSTKSAESAMLSFSKVAQLVAGSLTAGAVIKAADDWGQMAARIKMTLNSVEGDVSRYSEIQERFLEVSNRNGKAIETTQELYAGSATSMKELGYNTTQTVDYIESLSSAFTSNATSAQQTESAMTALNRAMVVGTLKGNDWHSVLNAIPSAVGDVANELSRMRGGIKVTENDVKKMAVNGGIDMKLFANALINARDANNSLADSMDNTVADGFTKLTNSAKAYYGELNQTYGVTRNISAGFAVLSNNFDKVADAANIAAVVVGARMAGALVAAGSEKLKYIAAGLNQAKAEAISTAAAEKSAIALVGKAKAEHAAALAAQERAMTEYNAAKGSANEAVALSVATAAKERSAATSLVLAQAERTQAAASIAAGAAARSAAVGIGLMNKALSLVGGPLGVAVIAGMALFSLWESAKRAKEESIAFADSLDGLIQKMGEMNSLELDGVLAKTEKSIESQKDQISDLEKEVKSAKDQYNRFTPEAMKAAEAYGQGTQQLKRQLEASHTLREKTADLETAKRKLSDTQEKQSQIQAVLTQRAREASDAFDSLANDLRVKIPNATQSTITAFATTIQVIDSLKKKAAESISVPDVEKTDDQKKLIKLAERRLALSKLEGEAKAKLQAQYDAEDVGLSKDDPVTKQLQDQYAQTEKNTTSAKKNNAEGRKSAETAATIAEKLSNLKQQAELAADSTTELSRAMAIQKAGESLGSSAKPEEVQLAEAYAATIWDRANAFKALATAESLLPQKQESTRYTQETKDLKNALDAQKISREEFNQASERAERQHQSNLAKIRSDSVVSPQQEAAGMVDPVQQLANENARKLALIQQYENDKTLTEQQGIQLRNAANREFEAARIAAQWEIWRQQSLGNEVAAAAFDSFAGNVSNSLTGVLTGSMTASDAMRSLGRTVLNSVINTFVQMGVEQAKAAIFGATVQQTQIAATTAAQTAAVGTQLAVTTSAAAATTAVQVSSLATQTAASTASAAATTAAWTPAAIMASIGSFGGAAAIGLAAVVGAMAISGKRKNGGPVSAGAMYQVGEGGKPEIFKASNGSQYMIPGDNGKVISNKDIGGSGGGNVTVIIENHGTPQVVSQQREQGLTGQDVIRIIMQDADEKGPGLQSIMRNTTAGPRL